VVFSIGNISRNNVIFTFGKYASIDLDLRLVSDIILIASFVIILQFFLLFSNIILSVDLIVLFTSG